MVHAKGLVRHGGNSVLALFQRKKKPTIAIQFQVPQFRGMPCLGFKHTTQGLDYIPKVINTSFLSDCIKTKYGEAF